MKVGIVCAFDTYMDRVELLKEFYLSKGAEVLVFGSDFSHRQKKTIEQDPRLDITVHARPYTRNLSWARLRSHYDFSKQVAQLVQRENLDWIHVLVPCNSLVHFMTPLHTENKKLVFDIIDLWPETMPIAGWKDHFPLTIWKNMRDKTLDQADILLMECRLFAQTLQKEQDPKAHVLYWARSQMPIESHPSIHEKELSFCYLGSMNHIIDIDFIVKFLKACAQYRSVALHLIGDGESKEKLIKNVQAIGVRVLDHHKIYDQREKQAIFDQCHYGLNVMKENVVVGLTMKSLDYMCGQLPLINTIKGDTEMFCRTENIGFHVPHDQIEPMAQRVCAQTLQEQMIQRQNIRDLYLRYFTKDSFFTSLDQIWEANQ